MRRLIATALVALAVASAQVTPVAASASRDGSARVRPAGVELPGAAADSLAVDPVKRRLYAPDEASSVVALELTGAEIHRVKVGDYHVRQVSVSPDGSMLWAASGGIVAGVDTATWEVRSFPIGNPDQGCVGDLAALDTGVVVVDVCSRQLLLLDPASGAFTTIAALTGGDLSVTAFQRRVFVKDHLPQKDYIERVRAYDVTGTDAAEIGSVEVYRGEGPVEVASDGSHVMLSSEISSTLDLTRQRRFFADYGAYPAVDGRGIEDFSYGLRLYAADTRGALTGVRWEADTSIFAMGTLGTTVYALGQRYSDPPRLYTWTPGAIEPHLEAAFDRRVATYRLGATVTLTASAPFGTPGTPVEVVIRPRDLQERVLASGVLADDRTFTVQFPAERTATLQVRYAGDPGTKADSVNLRMRVKQQMKLVPIDADRVRGGIARFSGGTATYGILLAPTYSGNCVRVSFGTQRGEESGQIPGCVRLPIDDTLVVTLKVPRRLYGETLYIEVREYTSRHGGEDFIKNARAVVRG